MKLADIISEEEFPTASDGFDSMSADNQNAAATDCSRDIHHKEKTRILKIGRGENFKKAKGIIANALADARKADAENIDTPQEPGDAGYNSALNMRLT